MKELNILKHKLLFAVVCAAILAGLILSCVGNGYHKTVYSSHTEPETTESYTRSAEEKESLQADFDESVALKAVELKDSIAGSKLFAVSVKGLSKGIDFGKRIARGDYINGYPAAEDMIEVEVPEGTEAAIVKRVVDGDTLFVRVIGSNNPLSDLYTMSEEELSSFYPYIRLYGVNTQESEAGVMSGYVDEATPEGKIASDYLKSKIEEGQLVWLSACEGDKDVYDRYLRLVWTDMPSVDDLADDSAITEHTVQSDLLGKGLAETMFVGSDSKYKELFTSIQSKAMQDMEGLWKMVE